MYFKKLNLPFNLPKIKVAEIARWYGIELEDEFRGIWYNNIEESEKCSLKDCIPKEYRDSFNLHLMQINSVIFPHTDSNTSCSINFYMHTNKCITQFYEPKENIKPLKIENQTDGNIYKLEDLEMGPSFLAQPGDVYLLNVSKPHSVAPPTDDKVLRTAFCLSTNKFTFEEVSEMLADK